MRTIETKVYKFDELNDEAKERARQWWREGGTDCELSELCFDDAVECAKIIGIDIDTKQVPRMDGRFNEHPKIYFSGFSSQGDGACFEGYYSHEKGSTKAIREHAPQDKELHAIADALAEAQKTALYGLSARCKHSGHYYHSGCMSVDVTRIDAKGNDAGVTDNQDAMITQCMRDFADWIYSQLENEYEYRNRDEQVDESIRANEYEFEEDGTRA